MTPADEIRAAAAKLRALAENASTDDHGRDTSTWTSEHRRPTDARLYGPDRTALLHGGSSGPHGRGIHPHLHPRHADYIAAVDPGVGKALADLLTFEADLIDTAPHLTVGPRLDRLLAAARHINQETT